MYYRIVEYAQNASAVCVHYLLGARCSVARLFWHFPRPPPSSPHRPIATLSQRFHSVRPAAFVLHRSRCGMLDAHNELSKPKRKREEENPFAKTYGTRK